MIKFIYFFDLLLPMNTLSSMDTKALQSIGLTDGEIRVYLALLKLGPSTSGPITDKSKVSSSKIYNILERLMQKGIVSYIVKEKTRHYQAEDPVKIREYVDKREVELQSQKKEIEKLIPELKLQQQTEKTKSEAQIYKGFKGVQAITDHLYLRLKKGDTWYNIGVPSFQEEKYHSYWHEDHLKRIKHGIKSKMLFNPKTPREVVKNRNSYKDCEARYMPIPVETPSWILIYKDVTVIILPGQEPIAVEIINNKIADSFMEYFNAFWKMSKPFK
jgi:HTH-type transcriptional regulator, sugar sensing transcriptional regulator